MFWVVFLFCFSRPKKKTDKITLLKVAHSDYDLRKALFSPRTYTKSEQMTHTGEPAVKLIPRFILDQIYTQV